MGERALLLDLSETHLGKPAGSAIYEFMDVDENRMPEGDHQLVGTLNGTSVYLADPCLDLDGVPVDGETGFSAGTIRLWNNEYSGTNWDRTATASEGEFQGFDANQLGDFVAQNHARIKDDNELVQGECMIVSSIEPQDYSPLPEGNSPEISMKI